MNNSKVSFRSMAAVMLCFFAMGFVDLVGIASNYVKEDLGLSDSMANMLPSLLFVWFLVFSIPTSLLMNKIGRKKTVLLSLVLTALSLFIPIFGENLIIMLITFSMLGIGNTLLQTSLNPLVATVMQGGNLASTLTFGQFVKAIASFMAPFIASWGAMSAIPHFGLGWRVLFPIYMIIGVLATLFLLSTPIEEKREEAIQPSSFWEVVKLLGNPAVLLCFIAIACHVGIDVGTNATAPKIFMEKLSYTLDEAAFATSLYFIFRTIGSFTGSFFLRKMSSRVFLFISLLMLAIAMGLFIAMSGKWFLYVAVALMGYGNSNIFSIIFARALEAVPSKQNEVSGLMIMGLFGGTIFPLLMGIASDQIGQVGAILVMFLGVLYLSFFARSIPRDVK